ncbi:MAG: ribosome silencing factor [Chlamydiae bacterium RIFCSPHIGHO2_12_FULL_49_9]|nr:MAG: ribosome silencing factor [Chlamydiae bacterium RIFCSPHIGHO2_12_FULL_49_9]
MSSTPLEALNAIAQVIYDKKGFNILALDVMGLSSITDFLLIAEGNIDRHVASIGRAVVEELRQKGYTFVHTEGLQSGDWVVLDIGGIMVHLFTPGQRERYALERLWVDSKIVDLDIDVSKPAIG